MALATLVDEFDLTRPLRKLHADLIDAAFISKEQASYVHALYEKAPAMQEEFDGVLIALMEGLAEDDVDKADDLRQVKSDLAKAAMRKLAARQSKKRAESIAARTKRRIAQKARSDVKRGKMTNKLRAKKKSAREPAESAPSSRPPAAGGEPPAAKHRRQESTAWRW